MWILIGSNLLVAAAAVIGTWIVFIKMISRRMTNKIVILGVRVECYRNFAQRLRSRIARGEEVDDAMDEIVQVAKDDLGDAVHAQESDET